VTVNEAVGNATGIDFTAAPVFTTPQPLPDGLSMVGVPCTPLGDDAPATVFGTDQLCRWSPSISDYVSPTAGDDAVTRSFLSVAPGKGYFVRMDGEQDVSVAGVPAATDTTFLMPLGVNWNLVANPFNAVLPFANILADASGVLPYGFVYQSDSGTYLLVTDEPGINVARTSVNPWEGLWLRATQLDATLSIQPVGPLQDQMAAPQQLDLGAEGWALALVARVAGRADLSSVAGVTAAGSGYRIDNPPTVAGTVDLYFVDEQGNRLAHDVRTAAAGDPCWDFVVSTDIPDSEVTVSLPDVSEVPRGLVIMLTDLDTSRTTYARTMPCYAFRSNSEGLTERHLRLSVMPRQDQGLVISAASVQPTQSGLTVTYSVSKPCSVTVQVLNIAGRLVSTVCADEVAGAGTNVQTWTLRSDTGRLVPAGRYLVCVEAVAEDGQRVRSILLANVVR